MTDLRLRAGSRARACPRAPRRSGAHAPRCSPTLCRLNTLYMIARAGSGHIGTQLQQPRHRRLAAPPRAPRPRGSRAGRTRPVLLLQGPRRPRPLRRAHRPRAPCRSRPFTRCGASAVCRATRTSTTPGIVSQHRLARHGDLEGQGHGAGAAARGPGRDGSSCSPATASSRRVSSGSRSRPPRTRRMGEITVIVDHNKIQSDTLGRLGERPRRPGGQGRRRSAGRSARCDGHDLAALATTLEVACAACATAPS